MGLRGLIRFKCLVFIGSSKVYGFDARFEVSGLGSLAHGLRLAARALNFAVWHVGYRVQALGCSVVATDFWITLRVQGPK